MRPRLPARTITAGAAALATALVALPPARAGGGDGAATRPAPPDGKRPPPPAPPDAHAGGHDDAAVRAALPRSTRGDAKLPHAFLKADAQLRAAPGAPLIVDGQGGESELGVVVGHRDGARLLFFEERGARFALWTPDDQLAPAVGRETGIALAETDAPPAVGGDGLFAEPGVLPREVKGGRARVSFVIGGAEISGWVDAGALAPEHVPDRGPVGWRPAPDGWKLQVGATTLDVAGDPMHKLGKDKGEAGEVGWRARGALTFVKPPPAEAGTRDRAGHTTAVASATAVPVPVGACIYDEADDLVGVVTQRDAFFATVDGDHLSFVADPPMTSPVRVRTHGAGKHVERCDKK